jgi:lysophospholipase L1-like esterase
MQPRLVFLGDSITEGWSTHGLRVWQSELEGFGAFNMGVSGDRIQNLLWRINHGALDVINPVGIVVAIGTNNARFYSAREIVRGLHAVVERIHRQHPNAAIIVLSLLPRDTPNSHQRNIVMQVNSELSESFKEVEFAEVVDVGKAFVDDADEIVKDLMPDSLHPSENGYRELARCLRPFLLQIDEQLVRKTDTSSKGRSSDVGISADDR